METDKDRIAIGVGDCSAVIIRGIGIIVSSHHYSKSLAFEFQSRIPREYQNNVLLYGAALASRAIVGAAVRRIENDHRSRVNGRLWRWWNSLWQARLLRRSRRRLCGLRRRLAGRLTNWRSRLLWYRAADKKRGTRSEKESYKSK